MSTGIVVFARLDSGRLPGKALRPIAGRALLGRVIDRARLVEGNVRIVVATSDRTVDDAIADFATGEGLSVFRGASDDVAGRALACLDAFKFDRFIRICGDSPFVDPALIGRLLEIQSETGADIATNVLVRTFPPGASVEVVTRDAMARIVAEALDPDDREHVTRFIYRHPERFHIVDLQVPAGLYAGLNLVVDTPQDLARANAIMHGLGPRPERASFGDVVRLARRLTDGGEV